MQSQRAKDTKPEIALRRELHRRGVRFRVGRPLPGLPRRSADIMWTARKVAVFVDGCYWHGCPEHFHIPKSNTGWWLDKIGRNQERDAATTRTLEESGWLVVRIWEHEDVGVAADAVMRALEKRGLAATRKIQLEPSGAADSARPFPAESGAPDVSGEGGVLP